MRFVYAAVRSHPPTRLRAGEAAADSAPAKEAKLTRKEKKKLEREARLAAEEAADEARRNDVLSQFSLSFAGNAGGDDAPKNANDVVVEGFSITAPERSLLTEATLKLHKGRRYVSRAGWPGPRAAARHNPSTHPALAASCVA